MSGLNLLNQATVQLSRVDCAKCGTVFGISEQFERKRRDDHLEFYCPNGHRQWYPHETEAERLRKALEQTEKVNASITADLQNVRAERDHHWIERKKTNTRLRHLKERVKHGVCPCCNRTFQNLRRHMATKHPSFVSVAPSVRDPK